MTIDELKALCADMKKPLVDDGSPDPVLDLATGWNQALDAVVRRAILDGHQ